jgi:hypothetical protein
LGGLTYRGLAATGSRQLVVVQVCLPNMGLKLAAGHCNVVKLVAVCLKAGGLDAAMPMESLSTKK